MQLAWDLLAKLDATDVREVFNHGVERYLTGDLPVAVALNVLEGADGKVTEDLMDRVRSHQKELSEQDPLGRWSLAIEGGDVESGRKLFFEDSRLSCLRCHQVGRAGGQVGPNLTTIAAKKDRRYLLESICTPNAVVAEGFETALVLTADGETIAGIVKSENEDFLDLIKADGSMVRLELDDVEARRKGKSSMPDDLIDKLTMRQLRDLVAYLSSLTTDPRSADEVE
jgi:quinoprotein glucose dehydrogenase